MMGPGAMSEPFFPWSYHCHSRFDDGQGELEEYALAALGKGFQTLGFSGHAPLPFRTGWTMPPELLPEYLRTARELSVRYASRLRVLLGLEVDYIPGIASPASPFIRALGLDYTIGSVHFLGELAGGGRWTVDGPLSELERGLAESYGGDARRAVTAFYALLQAMLREGAPDVIGHFDLIKKNNRGERFFSESAPWYRGLVLDTLEVVRHCGCLLEINTGGLTRNTSGAFYPSKWVLAECLRRDIPILVSSDAHRPEELDGFYPQAHRLLRELGFRHTFLLTGEGRRAAPL
jgi:histidinol-phosphatase (PHP family)